MQEEIRGWRSLEEAQECYTSCAWLGVMKTNSAFQVEVRGGKVRERCEVRKRLPFSPVQLHECMHMCMCLARSREGA